MNGTLALRAVLAATLALGSWLAVSAEVSVDFPAGSAANTVVFGGAVDDPDPIVGAWIQIRPIDPARVLNADGDARGDGRPDMASFWIPNWESSTLQTIGQLFYVSPILVHYKDLPIPIFV